MYRVIIILIMIFLSFTTSACTNEGTTDTSLATQETKDILCTVDRLYAVSYNNTSGTTSSTLYYFDENGAGGASVPLNFFGNETATAKYYAILTDAEERSYRFELPGECYGMLAEGQSVDLQAVTTYTPDGDVYGTRFYIGIDEVELDAEVTGIFTNGLL